MRCIAMVVMCIYLSGCAGSLAKNVNHKDRRDFKIDGFRIAVVPQEGHWSAWYVSEALIEAIPALPLLKAAEIKAIETYSQCKVTSAELVEGSLQPAYLQALVACDNRKKDN